jgi:hypothetical protein
MDRAGVHPSGPFPFVRVRGPALIVGLSTAVARPPLIASGYLGGSQRDALAAVLADPGLRHLTPVVLAHHPVLNPASALRRVMRGLSDADALRDTLLSRPETLSLHGHLHRRGRRTVTREGATIHVLGATSASLEHHDFDRAAAYNVYDLDDAGHLHPDSRASAPAAWPTRSSRCSTATSGFQKLVVLKRMHASLGRDSHFVRMFLDEARLAARLSHPNVVATSEVGEIDGPVLHRDGVPRGPLPRPHRAEVHQARRRHPPGLPPPGALRLAGGPPPRPRAAGLRRQPLGWCTAT